MTIYKHLPLHFYFIFVLGVLTAYSQTSVLTQHNDLYRTGWNNKETVLNEKNVNKNSFGEIFSRNVDDQIYAQPLVVSNVNISGKGSKNIVIVATVNNTLYAFDADSANVSSPYWQSNLTPSGSRVINNGDMTGACSGNYKDFSGNIGIVGTPVIDSVTNTIYLVARSVTIGPDSTFQQYFHALDLTTGLERPNSPLLITAQVAGTGSDNSGGIITFNSRKQNQRAGLLLLNGIVYITWASHCDWGPYHGWVLGYDKTSLQQKIVYNDTPNGNEGGIWMSGAAPSADDSGNVYLATSNGSVGTYNDPSNLVNRSESALKLTPSGDSLTVKTFFTPKNYKTLEAYDKDFGVAGMLLIPNTNRVLTGSKDGNLYLLDRNNMGGYDSTANHVAQTITLGTNVWILRSSLSYYKGEQKEFVYSWSEKAPLYAFPYDRTADTLDVKNAIISCVQGPQGGNGSFSSVSSNGSVDSTAILWVNQAANGANANQVVRHGVLRAFSATNVTNELWNSEQFPTDDPGNYAKFNCPTVANGKVYLATFSNKLMVYGLRKLTDTCPSVNIALHKPVVASSQVSGLPASAACDSSMCTRWGSNYSDPQWIYVDLGATYDLCEVVIKWETALARDFKIQVSGDAVNWTTIDYITGNVSHDNYLPLQGSGRYVRVYGIASGTSYGYSIWEFQVYGQLHRVPCAIPSNLAVSDIYSNIATLHWDGNGANKFNVQYKTIGDSSWMTLQADTNFINLSGLFCDSVYSFRVQAICDVADTGNYSSATQFSTLACPTTAGEVCPGGSTVITSDLSGSSYKWQVNTGSGFADITDTINYNGINSSNLVLDSVPSKWYGYKYRCLVDSGHCKSVVLKFSNTWTGNVDSSWENPANWSCGKLPDANTDVIINAGKVIVNSSPNVRSLTLGAGVNFILKPNFTFTINH
ncbi:hypothetical protein FW778_11420 [Ginsengibacter hankyongi]|uniref:F5/8 type C domain-containing protein n=1 Tax=Ginsengibacter hankyongi TaxID=2607284 RepID=A0A5J5IH02_9BACT|nr:discoidin domain-containing protein [Ginsengibacter hankyongi]KAA9039424.1 hypothetical protein FW778_11420 [Ginsengibacter hankyongi]